MKELLRESPFFAETFDGFSVNDCTVRDRNIIYFTACINYDYEKYKDVDDEDFPEELLEKRFITYYRDEPIESAALGIVKAYYLTYAMECEMTYTPKPQCVVTLGDGTMLIHGSGTSEEETSEETQATSEMKCIGDKTYLAQGRRRVHYRKEETWKVLGDNDSHPAKGMFKKNSDGNYLPRKGDGSSNHLISDCGFSDIDGFDENHIYAVGGRGDVWRCIDNEWIKCGFPTNVTLTAVCCADDGNVYISGKAGVLFVGKEDSWELLTEPDLSTRFNDIIWFDDRLWLTNSYGLWWVKNGDFQQADVPSQISVCSGRLSARDGLMVLAGTGGACLYEDGKWTLLFNHLFLP